MYPKNKSSHLSALYGHNLDPIRLPSKMTLDEQMAKDTAKQHPEVTQIVGIAVQAQRSKDAATV